MYHNKNRIPSCTSWTNNIIQNNTTKQNKKQDLKNENKKTLGYKSNIKSTHFFKRTKQAILDANADHTTIPNTKPTKSPNTHNST